MDVRGYAREWPRFILHFLSVLLSNPMGRSPLEYALCCLESKQLRCCACFLFLSKNKTGSVLVTFEVRSCNHCYSGESVSITYCECACSLSYPTCTGHAPYCHLWPVRLYIIVPHYLINDTIFEKKNLLTVKCAF